MMLRPFALGLSSGFIRNQEICKMMETPSKTSKSFPFLEKIHTYIHALLNTSPLELFSVNYVNEIKHIKLQII